MGVEAATYINQLNNTLPTAADMVSEGDDHIRLLKSVSQNSFPNVNSAVAASSTELSYVQGATANLQNQINAIGSAASLAFWVSGTTYAQFSLVRSTLNGRTYMKTTASSVSTIDPASDPTNWTPYTTESVGSVIYMYNNFGGL